MSSLDLSTDAAVQKALLSLIAGTSATLSPSEALRRVNIVSKRMLDTVTLRENLLSTSDEPWMPDVAKGIFVEKKHEVASLDGTTRIEAVIKVVPHPSQSSNYDSDATLLRFLYNRRPCGLNASSEKPFEIVRPLSVKSSTLVTFECWVTPPLGSLAHLIEEGEVSYSESRIDEYMQFCR